MTAIVGQVADVYHDTISEHKDGLTMILCREPNLNLKQNFMKQFLARGNNFKGGNSECHNDNLNFLLFVPLN